MRSVLSRSFWGRDPGWTIYDAKTHASGERPSLSGPDERMAGRRRKQQHPRIDARTLIPYCEVGFGKAPAVRAGEDLETLQLCSCSLGPWQTPAARQIQRGGVRELPHGPCGPEASSSRLYSQLLESTISSFRSLGSRHPLDDLGPWLPRIVSISPRYRSEGRVSCCFPYSG